jgi:hypothetical protein
MTSAAQGIHFGQVCRSASPSILGRIFRLIHASSLGSNFHTQMVSVRSYWGEFGSEPMPKSEPMRWYFTTFQLAQLRWVYQRD